MQIDLSKSIEKYRNVSKSLEDSGIKDHINACGDLAFTLISTRFGRNTLSHRPVPADTQVKSDSPSRCSRQALLSTERFTSRHGYAFRAWVI